MTTFRGLVNTLQTRDDGWVEVIIQAVHAGNTTEVFYIKDLGDDNNIVQNRPGQLGLLRDAITRVLPVEIHYETDPTQGNLIHEVMIHPRTFINGGVSNALIQGTVIGVSIMEVSRHSGLFPYTDTPDIAGITVLKDDGAVVSLQLDLQREDSLKTRAMLDLLQTAHKNRRPVIILTGLDMSTAKLDDALSDSNLAINSSMFANQSAYIESCEWVMVTEESLDYCHAFIDRLGQRYESYDLTNPLSLSHISVVYTIVPFQIQDQHVSEYGSFEPDTQIAIVPNDSPLLPMLKMALQNRLQVQLGILGTNIHEVEVIGHLGGVSRPVWICVNQSVRPENGDENCDNTPTTLSPCNDAFSDMALRYNWKGTGYFNEGIWRLNVSAQAGYELKIDGNSPCCLRESSKCCCVKDDTSAPLTHAYLNGMHTVELTLHNQRIGQPFTLSTYRIR